MPKKLGSYILEAGNITVASGAPKTISVPGKIFAVISYGSGLMIACPYWDGSNLINNGIGSVHVSTNIANDRKSVTFGNTQSSAKTVNYAIFYD